MYIVLHMLNIAIISLSVRGKAILQIENFPPLLKSSVRMISN